MKESEQVLALRRESRILRHCWDAYEFLLFKPLFEHLTVRERGNTHKPDRKTGLTFNTSQQCLRIVLSCFRARTSGRKEGRKDESALSRPPPPPPESGMRRGGDKQLQIQYYVIMKRDVRRAS